MSVVLNESRYSRILSSNGSPITSTDGKLNVNADVTIAGVCTDATVSAMSNKLPASLGIKNSAGSLSIVPSSDSAFNVTASNLGIRSLTNADVVTSEIAKVPITSGILWDNKDTKTNGNSKVGDVQYSSKISIYGTVSGVTTLIVAVSDDGTNWYASETSYNVPLEAIVSGSANFHMFFQTGCRYIRLISTNDVKCTAKFSGKM